jgi:hypothetical protein
MPVDSVHSGVPMARWKWFVIRQYSSIRGGPNPNVRSPRPEGREIAGNPVHPGRSGYRRCRATSRDAAPRRTRLSAASPSHTEATSASAANRGSGASGQSNLLGMEENGVKGGGDSYRMWIDRFGLTFEGLSPEFRDPPISPRRQRSSFQTRSRPVIVLRPFAISTATFCSSTTCRTFSGSGSPRLEARRARLPSRRRSVVSFETRMAIARWGDSGYTAPPASVATHGPDQLLP